MVTVAAGSTTGGAAARRGLRVRWATFIGVAGAVVIADQISKAWVAANFEPTSVHAPAGPGGPTQVMGDLVRIAVTHNDGGIFGLAGSSAVVLGLASLVVIAFIIYYEARQGVNGPWLLSLAMGLLLGGALGNLIDRFHFGYVIDWVDMGIGDVRWYTFNVADAAISTSIVLLLFLGLFGDRLARRGAPADGGTVSTATEGAGQETDGEGEAAGIQDSDGVGDAAVPSASGPERLA